MVENDVVNTVGIVVTVASALANVIPKTENPVLELFRRIIRIVAMNWKTDRQEKE